MPTNKLIWVLVGLLAAVFVITVINKTPPNEGTAVDKKAKPPAADKIEDVRVRDVSGDTVSETLKETQGKIAQSRQEQLATAEKMQEEIDRLRQDIAHRDAKREEDKRQELAAIMDEARLKIKEEAENARAMVSQGMDHVSKVNTDFDSATHSAGNNSAATSGNYKFNESDLGLKGEGLQTSQFNNTAMPGYVTVQPLKASSQAPSAMVGATGSAGLAPVEKSLSTGDTSTTPTGAGSGGNNGGKKKPKNKSIPYYTLHANATAMDARAMTAIIGRVPVGGRTGDRFPVKFILGSDTLSANGHRIPGLEGIIFSGLATGNWSMSCASVALTSATFVFKDGRIQHLPSPVKSEADGIAKERDASDPFATQGTQQVTEAIGYVSTRQGIPCIPGRQITDAPRQLTALGVLGAARAYFDAKAKAETTQITSLESGLSGRTVTGDAVKFANNETAANSVGTVMDFYQQRFRDTFDVIFVPPGLDVSLHIERDLLIDYNTNARKIAYNRANGGSDHALD
jgi:integrating conjugative element protein (TIGR03752 family)